MTTRFRALALSLPLLILAAPAAEAHVSFEKQEAAQGSFYKAVLKVPHGCEGNQETNEVSIEVPEGFVGVKPMPKPGWTLTTKKGPYAGTYAYLHGKELKEGVKTIVWSNGALPDEYFDEFVFQGYVAKEIAAPTTLYFKVTQRCPKGELNWVETPAEGQDLHALKAPAAALKITAKMAAAPASTGPLAIANAWARPTPGGAKVGAAYLSITNTGADDVLVAVSTEASARGEIHDMTLDNGVMKMRHMTDGLPIAKGETADLKPGGKHLMLMDLKAPLVEGQSIRLTLTFKSGATQTLDVPVMSKPAQSSTEHQH